MTTETEYSDYADRAEIPTSILFPGHIVRKQGGSTVLDLEIKMVDDNNPYLVFPVPKSVGYFPSAAVNLSAGDGRNPTAACRQA